MTYRNLKVYQVSYQQALVVHKRTLKFPKLEQSGLASQLRRSSKSIVANLAEGMGKQQSDAEVKRYLYICLGSCDETRVWIEFCKDLDYITLVEYTDWDEVYIAIGKMLRGLIARYGRSI
jgi:four helix bundle protein